MSCLYLLLFLKNFDFKIINDHLYYKNEDILLSFPWVLYLISNIYFLFFSIIFPALFLMSFFSDCGLSISMWSA